MLAFCRSPAQNQFVTQVHPQSGDYMKGTIIKRLFTLLAPVLFCTATNAQFVDQHNEPVGIFTYFATSPSGGVGQSFRPNLSSLDFVELQVFNQAPVGPATFSVGIRNGSITGNLLGMSQLTTITPPTALGPAHFDFLGGVALTPGNSYVLEISEQVGGAGWGVGYGPGAGYANGQAFTGGNPVNFDLWFREGAAAVPEPNTWLFSVIAVAGAGLLRKIFARRDQRLTNVPA